MFLFSRTVLGVALLSSARLAMAHDIPSDFTVQMVVRPEARSLRVEVKVPQNVLETPLAIEPWFRGFTNVRENGVLLTTMSLTSEPAASEDGIVSGVFDFPIHSASSAFTIRAGMERHGTRCITAIRFITPAGNIRAYELLDDSGDVTLDPRWYQAASRFIGMGFLHILEGPDHLLFLLCLVIPVRRFRTLIAVVTAFTVAHSTTLIASALGFAPSVSWFPPFVEALIAASIVYMAVDNVIGAPVTSRRWIVAFCFGLVHGFGFSFALKQTLQFAGAYLLSSLLSFNVGVELGQIAALAVAIPVLRLIHTRRTPIVLSIAAGAVALYWLWNRIVFLSRYRFARSDAATVLRGLIVVVALGGGIWILEGILRKREVR
jgi:hypothetical protein